MTAEQYKRHLILKEYAVLKAKREEAIADYCTLLTKLTKVTQNLSPLPGHGSGNDYDEKVYELSQKFLKVREIDSNISMIRNAVNDLPTIECFVIRELYFQKRKAGDVAKMLDKDKRTIFRIRNSALNNLIFIQIV